MIKLNFLALLGFLTCCTGSHQVAEKITTASGLIYSILKDGSGTAAQEGHEVLIHETMSYLNDSLLFSSYTLPHPVKILIGGHQAIDGIDEGLRGMRVGEIRRLIVPPALSRRSGNQTFPHPDSTLLYRVELIDILNKRKRFFCLFAPALLKGIVITFFICNPIIILLFLNKSKKES